MLLTIPLRLPACITAPKCPVFSTDQQTLDQETKRAVSDAEVSTTATWSHPCTPAGRNWVTFVREQTHDNKNIHSVLVPQQCENWMVLSIVQTPKCRTDERTPNDCRNERTHSRSHPHVEYGYRPPTRKRAGPQNKVDEKDGDKGEGNKRA